jgi:hypothetical protein
MLDYHHYTFTVRVFPLGLGTAGEKRFWADSKPYLGCENEWVSMIDLHHIQTLAT